MSCGTKIVDASYSYAGRLLLADTIEEEDSSLARQVRNGEYLSYSDLRRVERILENAGLQRYTDFREERCAACSDSDE